jgi:hypothetical protein
MLPNGVLSFNFENFSLAPHARQLHYWQGPGSKSLRLINSQQNTGPTNHLQSTLNFVRL